MKSTTDRIQERSWSADWPQSVRDDFAISVSLADSSTRGSSSRFASRFSDTRRDLDAIVGKGSSSLIRVRSLLDGLETWNTNYQSFFSWPPSQESWNRAVRETAKSDPYAFIVLAACYPNAVLSALENGRAFQSPAAQWYAEARKPAQAPKAPTPVSEASAEPPQAAPEPAVEAASTPTAPAPAEKAASRPVAARKPPAAAPAAVVEPPAPPAWMIELLEIARAGATNGRMGVTHGSIDNFVKHQIHLQKGAAQDSGGYWFEDMLIPALAKLDPADLETLLDAWPPHLQFDLNAPHRVVGLPRFWGALKANSDDTRNLMLSNALPRLTDTSSWRAHDRYQMLPGMFEFARSEGEFAKRLGLWTAWGGDLDSEIPDPSTDAHEPAGENAFQQPAQKLLSARKWFAEHENAQWNKALDALPSRSPSRGPSP